MISREDVPVLAVISIGGGLGALARFAVSRCWSSPPGHVPWATMTINATGCFLIGVLMVLIIEVWVAHRLLRPFLGVGVLGGYTTFSTYAVDLRGLLVDGRYIPAFAYLFGTVVAALVAVLAGVTLTRMAMKVGGPDD